MKVVIFGSKGYMGQYFLTLYPDAATPSVDIADIRAVGEVLDSEKPDVVINCAGKTGRPNVDWCEDHKEETIHSNVVGPLVLVEECNKRNIYFVHLGTGCVYSGDCSTPFSETDAPNFFGSFYSRSKGLIDQLLNDFPVLNIRLRMPFDGTSNDRN
ncbi:MAG: sugar nucleotide-binding protein, partial [Candidatus Peribacteraceae bacterium]|nr:sugar nucleotide-binding protein [Candidatus Peribacteraceae bacterium]